MLICLIRCIDPSARIRHIAVYLRRIEEDSFLDNPNLRGWEHFKVDTKWIDRRTNTIAGIFWVLAIAGSIFTSLYLSTHPPKARDPSESMATQQSTNLPARKR